MRVIEFVGLPGSGKTTQAAHLTRELARGGFSVGQVARPTNLLRKLRVAVRYRRALKSAGGALLRDSRSVRERLLALRWLLSTLEVHVVAREGPESAVLVVAEGSVQRVLLTFMDAATRKVHSGADRYLRAAALPDVLVYLRVTPEEACARQSDRRMSEGSKRRGDRFNLDQPALLDLMRVADGLLANSVALLEKSYPVQIIEVPSVNTANVAEAVARQVVATLSPKR